MRKKFKIRIKDDLLEHINSKIKKNIKLTSILKEQILLNIKPNELIKPNIKDNQILLNKKIKVILGYKISRKFKKYNKKYNQNLSQIIYNENCIDIKDIFEMKLIECIRYYRKDEIYFENKKKNIIA